MAAGPMFYDAVVALNRDTHRNLRLDQAEAPYLFAANAHVIPALVDEFATASRTSPIIFAPGSPAPSPVFLVGLRPGQNAHVDASGKWVGRYIPAFVRRYPFILGETGQNGSVACIDERFPGFKKSSGERLFHDDGSDTPFLQQKIRLINDYFIAAKRTGAFVQALQDLQLLQPVTIETNVPGGPSAALHGLFVINEAKFNALAAEDLLKLRDKGFLGAVYAHLLSLNSMDELRAAASPTIGTAPAARDRQDAGVVQ